MSASTLTTRNHACAACGRGQRQEDLSDDKLCVACWDALEGQQAAYHRAYRLAHKAEVAG